MYEFIQKFHSGWAYLALLLLVVAVLNSVIGMVSKKEFSTKDRTIALLGLIAAHIQLLVGLVLYFVSPLGKAGLSEMSNAAIRLTALEHPLINIIAIVNIWSRPHWTVVYKKPPILITCTGLIIGCFTFYIFRLL